MEDDSVGTWSMATLEFLLGLRWYLLVSLSMSAAVEGSSVGTGPLSMKGRISSALPPMAMTSLLPAGSPFPTIVFTSLVLVISLMVKSPVFWRMSTLVFIPIWFSTPFKAAS